MALKRKLAPIFAAVASATLIAGCSGTDSDTDQVGTSSPRDSLVLVDGDSQGYITFDTDREVLRGYTRDGKKVWQEQRYFPTDVHCVAACPDAAVSATADMNTSTSQTHVLWKHGGSSTTQPFGQKSLVVQWARSRDTWVATSESGIVWSDRGKIRTQNFPKGIGDAMGRLSEDHEELLISVQPNGAQDWSAFRFPVSGGRLSPSLISAALPGGVGCLSLDQEKMWTVGDGASEFSLTTGKKIRATEQFASDCMMSDAATVLGAFSASSDESVQEISIASEDRPTSFKTITVKSAGEIGIFQDCGVLLSNGRLTTLSPQGKKQETDVDAHSMTTVPNGDVYSIGRSGKVERHTITADDGNCHIG